MNSHLPTSQANLKYRFQIQWQEFEPNGQPIRPEEFADVMVDNEKLVWLNGTLHEAFWDPLVFQAFQSDASVGRLKLIILSKSVPIAATIASELTV
ncbi:hypothetical protein MW887_009340 [Aspergillus wentii]|nr:hypothetical protein MW887_009340 [Aspergillus wentii]